MKGRVHASIFDLFQERVFWLKEPWHRQTVECLANGTDVEETGQRVGVNTTQVRKFLHYLEALDLGTFEPGLVFSERYRPAVLRSQEEALGLQRLLSRVVVETSTRCSLRCPSCGFGLGWASSLCACGVWPSQSSLPEFDVRQLVGELKACGCRRLHIQGGDPFLERTTLQDLAAAARDVNLEMTIQTPGVVLSEEDWGFLGDMDLGLVVPVFGATEALHDAATGVSGSFEALKALLARNRQSSRRHLTAEVILADRAAEEENAVREWLMSGGVQEIRITRYVSRDFTVDTESPSTKAFRELFKCAPGDFRVPTGMFFRLAKGHACWQDGLAVTRTGEVLPCIAARGHVIGNIARESILDVIRAKRHFAFRDGGNDSFTPCSLCEFRLGCNPCSLMTERVFGEWQHRSWNCTYDPLLGKWDHE
ncbi:MAG: SPASM domain-containing protein [candidate division WOR-3 bacterium]|nr:SPASM domain-containing protein [candidate division WOR-3 bacterium]